MTRAIDERLAYVRFDPAQRDLLAGALEQLAPMLDDGLEVFYSHISSLPATRSFFSDDAQMSRARGAQSKHWRRLLSGRFDADYEAAARRVGDVHARIGLEPRWYIGGYALLLEHVINALEREQAKGGGLFGRRTLATPGLLAALVKAILIDMEFTTSVYFERASNAEQEAAEAQAREAQLRELLSAIGHSADTIHHCSGEISAASEDLAHRTEQAASDLESASRSTAELEERLAAVASAAQQSAEQAAEASRSADAGQSTAIAATAAIEEVRVSTEDIDQVIQGLDKIAFQTRVLAMNATVEAGRAGEAGRSFAVVADLVSALALRAEEESRDARERLVATRASVSRAVTEIGAVENALQAICTNIGAVDGLARSMSEENRMQLGAVAQIHGAVAALEQATQQNAAMVEQTSAAARNMTAEAGELARRLSGFESRQASAA